MGQERGRGGAPGALPRARLLRGIVEHLCEHEHLVPGGCRSPVARRRKGGKKSETSSPEVQRGGSGKQGGGGSAAREAEAIPPKLKREAGKAAPFLVPEGDNSIPTYGSEASSSQQDEAAAALATYLVAREKGDWADACAGMGSAVHKQLEVLGSAAGAKTRGCAATYAALAVRAPASERADPFSGRLAAFRVKAQNAFALFFGPGNQQYMMPMVSEDGEWKVNQIAPVSYPPGAPPQ